jgi:hypothetical protein
MAVAYWGEGAISNLRLEEPPKSFRLICDLRSGSCNPYVVQALHDKRPTSIRYLDGLHAKVYLGDNAAIVGSANASAAGIGWEDREADCLTEAAVKVQDRATVTRVAKWMNDLWLKAKPAKDEDFETAKAAWRKRRAGRPPGLVATNALKDRPIFVVWFGFSPPTKKQQAKFSKWEKASPKGGSWEFYSDSFTSWIPAGGTLIPVDSEASSYVQGVRQTFDLVPDPVIVERVGKRNFIIPVRLGRTVEVGGTEIRLTRALRKRIWEGVVSAVAANPSKSWGMFPLSDVTAIPDGAVATAGGSGGHNRGKPNVMHACRVNGGRRVHRSVYQAFVALGLNLKRHEKFRLGLKRSKSGSAIYKENGRTFRFELADPAEWRRQAGRS